MISTDYQVAGSHYQDLKIQPIEYILANELGFCEGAIVKYISRWRQKGGVDDRDWETVDIIRPTP